MGKKTDAADGKGALPGERGEGVSVGSADVTESDNTEIESALIESDEGTRSEMKSADVIHEMGVVDAGDNRGEGFEDDGSLTFCEEKDGSSEAAVFEMMNGVAWLLKGAERISADEADPGETNGDKETELRLSAEMFNDAENDGETLFNVEVSECKTSIEFGFVDNYMG